MKAFGIEDPAALLVHMGMKFVHDFRSMDYNLVLNKARPALTLGSPIAGLLNGGFEGSYSSGVAPSWGKVGAPTGTFQEQTTLPWESSGTKAQEVIGNTNTNQPIMTQIITAGLTQYRTYKIKFKVKVTSGTLRVRVAKISPFVNFGSRDFVSGSEGEFYFYFANHINTNLNIELFNASASPLSFLIDDMTIEPLVNDTHLFLRADAFNESAWDGQSYNFSGGILPCFINWNADRDFRVQNSRFTALALTAVESTPAARTIHSLSRADLNQRSFITRFINGAPNFSRLIISENGTAVNNYQSTAVDPFPRGKSAMLVQYNGGEQLKFDGSEASGSYVSGGHQATLYDPVVGVPYCIGASIDGSLAYSSAFSGKMFLAGYDEDVYSEISENLMQAILKTYH